MAHDLAIPEEYGVYHTVGDTTGPGGWARFIRNFDVFASLAADINRYAPGAVVLNYTNPMTTLTDVLSRTCEGPVVGLCHGLFENLTFIKEFYKLKDESEIAVKYAGLNHFLWITEAKAAGRDVIADLNRRRGKIRQISRRGPVQVIDVWAPLGEMFGYSTDLRSASQGRASYTMQFDHYEPVPQQIIDSILGRG